MCLLYKKQKKKGKEGKEEKMLINISPTMSVKFSQRIF